MRETRRLRTVRLGHVTIRLPDGSTHGSTMRSRVGGDTMAKLVLGVATSHGPMLSTPWQEWGQRVQADKRSTELWFKGKNVSFDELVELRRDEKLENEITPEKMEARHTACQQAID